MTHTSLYRTWRPQTFDDVTGQEHVVRTLANALAQRRVSHAYLFSGPRGTGKTTVARLLAKSLNCARGDGMKACNECDVCQRITRGASMDVIEIDGASNRGIDEIREVRESIRFSPAEGRYRVYIIDEVHMLTTEAFNALLKVLEEPPAHGIFIFATTEPHRVPATVLSRCQRFDFRPLFASEVKARLETVCRGEGVTWDEGALDVIARHADGALRDALSILDQCIAFEGNRLTAEGVEHVIGTAPRAWFHRLVELMIDGDGAEAFRIVQDLRARGKDLRQFVRDATRHVRDLMVLASAPKSAEDLVNVAPDEKEAMARQAQTLGVERLLRALEELLQADADMRWAPNAQLLLEALLVRLAHSPPVAAMSTAPAAGGVQRSPVQPKRQEPDKRQEQPERSERDEGAGRPDRAERPEGTQRPQRPERPEPAQPPSGVERPGRTGKPAGSASSAAGSSQAPQGDGGDLGEIGAAWPRVLAALREARHLQTAAFLIEGRPARIDADGTLIIEFPPDRRFHRDSFERGRHRNYVEGILVDILGRPVSVRTAIRDEAAPKTAQESGAPNVSPATPDVDRRAPTSERSAQIADQATRTTDRGAPTENQGIQTADRGAHTPRQGTQSAGRNTPSADLGPQRASQEADQTSAKPQGERYPPAVEESLELFGGRVIAVERVEENL